MKRYLQRQIHLQSYWRSLECHSLSSHSRNLRNAQRLGTRAVHMAPSMCMSYLSLFFALKAYYGCRRCRYVCDFTLKITVFNHKPDRHLADEA